MAWLRGLARSLTADPSVADDLVQEAWLATMRARPDTSRPLRPWLSRVLRNLHLQRRRSEGRRAVREGRVSTREKDGAHGPDDLVARLEVHRLLGDLVLSLEEPYRTAVLLRYMEGLAPDEVAERTRVLPATARSRVSRGLDRLRKHLDRRFGGDRLAWCLLFLRVEGLGPFAPAPADGWIDGPAGDARPTHAAPRGRPRGGLRAGSAGLASAGAAAVAFLLTAIGMHATPAGGADEAADRFARVPAASGAVDRAAAGAPVRGGGERRGDGDPAEAARAGDAADAYADALDGSLDLSVGRTAAAAGDGTAAADGAAAAARGWSVAPESGAKVAAAATGAKSFRVAGRVVDSRGRGIAGARVDLVAPGALRAAVDPRELAASWLAPPRAAASATTDADGRFAASAPGEGPFHLRASFAGLRTAIEEGVLAGAPRTVVLAAGAAIEGRVRRDDGGPVADLAVAAFPAAGAPASFARTRPDGGFLLDGLAPGAAALVAAAAAPDLAIGIVPAAAGPGAAIEVVLGGGAAMEGTVFGPDGLPAPGAEVVVADLEGPGFVARAAADATGRYLLAGMPPGPAGFFRAAGAGAVVHPEGAAPCRLVLADGTAARDIHLGAGVEVNGLVLDAETGRPVPGAIATLAAPGADPGAWPRAEAGGDGAFALGGAPAGAAAVAARAPGFEPADLDAEALRAFLAGEGPAPPGAAVEAGDGEAEERTLLLRRSPALAGLVLDGDGEPVGGARVSWEAHPADDAAAAVAAAIVAGGSAFAAADGSFAVPAPPPGVDFVVTASAPGPFEGRSAVLRREPGAPIPSVVLRVHRGAVLEGRVVDEAGTPLRGAAVAATPWAGGADDPGADAILDDAPASETDAAGRFRLSPAVAGPHLLRARAPGRLQRRLNVHAGSAGVEVVLFPSLSLSGRVESADGTAIAGAAVSLVDALGRRAEASTGADGGFRFDGLPPGACSVEAAVAGLPPAAAVIPAGTAAALIRMPPAPAAGRTLSGSVVLGTGPPAAFAAVRITGVGVGMEISADADGAFEVRGLPPGEFVVRGVLATAGRVVTLWTGTLQVRMDGDQKVRLVLAPFGPGF